MCNGIKLLYLHLGVLYLHKFNAVLEHISRHTNPGRETGGGGGGTETEDKDIQWLPSASEKNITFS